MKNYICVYDFETDGTNPNECQPVQIAACMLHPVTLDIVDNSEFCSYMRPENIDSPDYFDKHKSTIFWHASNYEPKFKTLSEDEQLQAAENIYNTWFNAPSQKQVFENFQSYLHKYNKNQTRKNKFDAPIRAGMNIRRFDNIIIEKLCTKYKCVSKEGEQDIFYPRDVIDIMDLAFYWFENMSEPKNINMGELRSFFGMSQHGAHDALNDVRDEILMIQKFLRLHRRVAPKVNFKNAMVSS